MKEKRNTDLEQNHFNDWNFLVHALRKPNTPPSYVDVLLLIYMFRMKLQVFGLTQSAHPKMTWPVSKIYFPPIIKLRKKCWRNICQYLLPTGQYWMGFIILMKLFTVNWTIGVLSINIRYIFFYKNLQICDMRGGGGSMVRKQVC